MLDVVREEMKFDSARKVGYRGEVLEHFSDTRFEEIVVRLLLHFDEVGHVDDFVNLSEAAAFGVTVFDGTDSSFSHITPWRAA